MISRWRWQFMQLTRRLWVRAGLFSLLAVVTALLAVVAAPYIPAGIQAKIGADAVDKILSIIASSMLTVTTFSLTTMVTAFGSATSSVTPRATRLLIEDKTTHNVLATFLGSFLFSLVGIVALSAGVYGEQGRVVLFVATIGVIVLIVVTLLRWIDYLSTFGRVEDTTRQLEDRVTAAMSERKRRPYLGGRPAAGDGSDIPANAVPIHAGEIGYVQFIDMSGLADMLPDADAHIYLAVLPGSFVNPTRPLAWFSMPEDRSQEGDKQEKESLPDFASAFTIGDTRSFDQDPRFGMSVLSEIASRALSPAVNDPGTAIDVIGRAVRILAIWSQEDEEDAFAIDFPGVSVPAVMLDELFEDVFRPIARDGASLLEVQIRLQKAFLALAGLGGRYRESALRQSAIALQWAEKGLEVASDRDIVRQLGDNLKMSGKII